MRGRGNYDGNKLLAKVVKGEEEAGIKRKAGI
jgi:hypothetical protein